MKENKPHITLRAFALGLATALSSPAAAQVSAPALYDVREIQVENARLSNADLTAECGATSGEVSAIALKTLLSDSLPAFTIVDAPPPRPNVMRIDLLPIVSTIRTDEKTCTSWVSLQARSENRVVLPPVKTPRNIVVVYWEGGTLVHSLATAHPQAIINAADKLSEQFARQYRLDQPPQDPVGGTQPPSED